MVLDQQASDLLLQNLQELLSNLVYGVGQAALLSDSSSTFTPSLNFTLFATNVSSANPLSRFHLMSNSAVASCGDELAEGFTPDDHAAVAGWIDAGGQWHDEVVEGFDRPNVHHLRFQAGKIRLGFDKFR